ncbi:MAG: AbrB/MazE/SpoVT family DNA-binding domain-containing protein [Candidatus Magasanikbacteria bacterium]|nr:AbrB/MazE/SpoVT family DNA-binding domain-containing protein [Candidatus Magasanikbacteria bacterium]
MSKNKNKDKAIFGEFLGTTSIGERGQVVIPKEARERLNIKTGDKFLVVGHYGKLILLSEKEMKDMVKNITKHFKIK